MIDFALGVLWACIGAIGAARGYYRLNQIYPSVRLGASDFALFVLMCASGPIAGISWLLHSALMGRRP